MSTGQIHRDWTTRAAGARYSAPEMAIRATRTLRGAAAGALACGVWAAQQPLDKRVFSSAYDDVELLGKAVTRGRWWYALGLAAHVGNGALFGAAYANVAPSVPLAPWSRGPLAGMLEHVGLWSLVGAVDRLHPARRELPALSGNRQAFAQGLWRHALFGALLGELERRLNAGPEPLEPVPEEIVSHNGRGDFEHAVSAQRAT